MARIPQVTRTITTTQAKVLCLDLQTQQTVTKLVTVPRTYKDDAAVLKAVKRAVETDDLKAVHIVDVTVDETLYGMTEDEFIQHAKPLPARNIKASDTAENANKAVKRAVKTEGLKASGTAENANGVPTGSAN